MPNVRKIVADAIIELEKSSAYSNLLLNGVLSRNKDLCVADKNLLTVLFYGVLDRKITLDYILSKYIKTPVSKLSPITLQALRIAVYQIVYLDKIPESAAVNESVKIVKSSKESYNTAFVNGVLRAYLRKPAEIPSGDDLKSLSIRYSCPEYIIDGFIKDYGFDTAIAILSSSLAKPPVTIRVNTIKTDTDGLIKEFSQSGIKAMKLDNMPFSLRLEGIRELGELPSYKKGEYHIQDMASQRCVEILAPNSTDRVMDMCAAPGGKSFTMAQIMQNSGEILSFDYYKSRVDIIEKGAERLGLSIIKAVVGDATVYNGNLGEFDKILCDVPCSGLGVIRRKPEIKYKDIEDFSSLEETQGKILENAGRYLKKGGRLLYSTCTLRRAENDDRIKAFLDKHIDYELKYQHTYMPHIDSTDGFYCALLEKSR